MAVTITLIGSSPHRLLYQCSHDGVNDGNDATITNSGGASPDLQTDSPVGPLANIIATTVANDAAAVAFLTAGEDFELRAMPSGTTHGTYAIDAEAQLGRSIVRVTMEQVVHTIILAVQYRHSQIR